MCYERSRTFCRERSQCKKIIEWVLEHSSEWMNDGSKTISTSFEIVGIGVAQNIKQDGSCGI